jgi:putative endonuclease
MWSGRLSQPQEQGKSWEEAAQAYLEHHGLVLVESNFRCKLGEIDLIMRDGQVKAAASITPAKIRRLVRAAQVYLQRLQRLPPCRFDVVAIDGRSFEWIRNAIEA